MDRTAQLELFRAAVAAIGGPRRAAPRLKVHTRHLERLLAGASDLHHGFLRDIAAALTDHADHCRALERALSPAFAGNLTLAQLAGPPPRAANRNAARPEARRHG